MIDPNDKFSDAMGAGHDSDTAREYAGGSHRMPRVVVRQLSVCCDAESICEILMMSERWIRVGICEKCGEPSRFYVEGDE